MRDQAVRSLDEHRHEFQESVRYHLTYSLGKTWDKATPHHLFKAVAFALREQMIDRMIETENRYRKSGAKRLYYLSMEYLMGRSLGNNLINLGLQEIFYAAMTGLGVDLDEIREAEHDAALGNGGLGRLAACFLDSLATLGMPGFGYGINYEFGLFRQTFANGYQVEMPDSWARGHCPWLIEHIDESCVLPLYGRVQVEQDRHGKEWPMWVDWNVLIGTPHDMPVVGYGGRTVNFLRLFTAHASDEFDISDFNAGDYIGAVEHKIGSENVSKVLYPSDSSTAGKELRLVQEYFLVACAVRDIMRRYRERHAILDELPRYVAIQMNDTHPALAVPELMRVFIDEKGIPWERAWEITRDTLGYTNHTLLPEALERWPVELFGRVLPRHLQIVYEINQRFLEEVDLHFPDDEGKQRELSIIEEAGDKQVRMAHLAIYGSHSVNGVAALHTELVKSQLVPGFHLMYPERFNNKTNGVTQRRWLLKANPALASLLEETIGRGWITNLDELGRLEPYVDDDVFCSKFLAAKRQNKQRLAHIIRRVLGIEVDPISLFDVQAKRMHEYKRQLLLAMYIIHVYLDAVEGKAMMPPRTFIIAGKAAPAYWRAKLIIKLINNVARVINQDRRVEGQLKVAFLPDYRVTLAERIIPAADLSEQISTAGMEASGTGNMKFAMNGALTMGTLDGANIEIREEVGAENIFIFGLTADRIKALREDGYDPRTYYQKSPRFKRIMDAIGSDLFCDDEPQILHEIYSGIMSGGDHYMHAADIDDYIAAQERAGAVFRDRRTWARMAILNVARMGKFSSDRTVREYARDIWGIKAV